MFKCRVDITVGRAQGCQEILKDLEKIKDIDFINFKTAPVPQGNFNGRSKVFPKSISSAECGTRNLPREK